MAFAVDGEQYLVSVFFVKSLTCIPELQPSDNKRLDSISPPEGLCKEIVFVC